jgi:tetratricopeptide (TPR) repeat protein
MAKVDYDFPMIRLRRTIATLLLLSAVSAAHGASPAAPGGTADPTTEAVIRSGVDAMEAGDHTGAEDAFREALRREPRGSARAETLFRLGLALAGQERFDEAMPPIAEAEEIARSLRGTRSLLFADVLRAKTIVLYRTGRIEDARAAYREAKAIMEENANAWSTGPDGTTWHHGPSGWRFPEQIGPFARLRRTMFDETGYNVAVHYRIGPGGWGTTLVSVYVAVDRGLPLAEEFAESRAEILKQYPAATPVADTKTADGVRTTVLDLPPDAQGRIRRTSLAAFEKGRVTVRIRASYPAAEADVRAPKVAALTETVRASGP